MSYILEALRRADAERERERDAVPGLHAQPAGAPAASPTTTRTRTGLLLLAGLILGAAAAAAALLFGRPALAPVAASTPAPVAATLPSPAPTAPAATPTPRAVDAPLRAVLPAPLRVEQAAASSSSAPAPVPEPVPVTMVGPAGPAASARAAPLALADLPTDLKRVWPALAISGSIYSDNPSSRFIMVAGQVVREGDAAAPGVVVERIGRRSAVMRWKDLRVEVPF